MNPVIATVNAEAMNVTLTVKNARLHTEKGVTYALGLVELRVLVVLATTVHMVLEITINVSAQQTGRISTASPISIAMTQEITIGVRTRERMVRIAVGPGIVREVSVSP